MRGPNPGELGHGMGGQVEVTMTGRACDKEGPNQSMRLPERRIELPKMGWQ